MINFLDPPRRSLTRDDPSSFAAPAQFGPFRVLHQIGIGALGPVFRTYEPERDRLVAVKVFRLDITPEQAESLAAELSRAASAGLFHPSIVEPIAAGVEGSAAYNAEEYVAAESLDVAMRHYAPAHLDTMLPFITQLAGAIDFAAAAGVHHGALHPRDVFITPDEARATGFGVVEALERVGLRAPVRRPYSAPERIAGGKWSTEADVFSLAAIAYELLTGRRPAGLGGEIGPLTAGEDDERTRALHGVLVRAMDEDPSRRYPTALAFVAALEAASRGDAPSAAAAPLAAGAPPAAAVAPVVAAATLPSAAVPAAPAPPPRVAEPPAEVLSAFPDEDEEDIAAERDEDDADYRFAQQEALRTAAAAEIDVPLDEDSAIEAEADRYSGDDFLLDAAGIASAPELDAADDFRAPDADVDPRALEDDEVMVDEPPTLLFRPEDLVPAEHVAAPPRDERDDRDEDLRRPEPPVAAASIARQPSFGYYPADSVEPPQDRASRWPLVAVLVLGLIGGFLGGYALWGRSPEGAGPRDFSEQAVAPAPPSVSTSGRSSAAAKPPAGAPASAPSSTPRPSGSPSAAAPRAGAEPSPSRPAPAAPPAPRATTGSMTVRSTPSGANVTVNGRWRGRTPLTLPNLPFARYDVRVVRSGYASARESVTLSAAEPSRQLALRLPPQPPAARQARTPPPAARPEPAATFTSSIYVDSRPRGARVFVDGKPVGVTPLTVPEVRVGTHVVRLELPDHRIWTTSERVVSGRQSRVTGSLERIQ